MRDILKVGEDVYFIGAKGGWFDKDLQTFINKFLNTARNNKIKYFHIFDAEVKSRAPELLNLLGKPYKFLPPHIRPPGQLIFLATGLLHFPG